MATYIIGDIHGCYAKLNDLLEKISFNPYQDKLISVGDIINRGPNSLAVIELLSSLPNFQMVLGNHDLHLLILHNKIIKPRAKDILQEILQHPKIGFYCDFIKHSPLCLYLEKPDLLICHAGLYPKWSVQDALKYNMQYHTYINNNFNYFINNIYSDTPVAWRNDLSEIDAIRFIVNSFTRMRYLDKQLNLNLKLKFAEPVNNHIYWFQANNSALKNTKVVFGHWSMLNGNTSSKQFICLDTGSVYQGMLSTLQVDNMQIHSV